MRTDVYFAPTRTVLRIIPFMSAVQNEKQRVKLSEAKTRTSLNLRRKIHVSNRSGVSRSAQEKVVPVSVKNMSLLKVEDTNSVVPKLIYGMGEDNIVTRRHGGVLYRFQCAAPIHASRNHMPCGDSRAG